MPCREKGLPHLSCSGPVAPTPMFVAVPQATETRQGGRGQELPVSEVPGLQKWQIPREETLLVLRALTQQVF